MDNNIKDKLKKEEILTIPNFLSFFRILLIPVVVVLYCYEHYYAAVFVIFLSGLTDVADGKIARKFNMISDLGKALDPVADKLTQTATLMCLLVQFPLMWLPLSLLVVKEFISGIWRLIVFHRTREVRGAKWHGKVSTVLLYGIMLLHILWPSIPGAYSSLSIVLCTLMMILSFFLYSKENFRALKDSPCT